MTSNSAITVQIPGWKSLKPLNCFHFTSLLFFRGFLTSITARNSPNTHLLRETQIPAQILENCHPCQTKVCTELQKTHQSDCKILLACVHSVSWCWKIRIPDRSNVLGRSLEMSLQHKGSKIKMVCQTKVCTEILKTHPSDRKILLAWVRRIPWGWKIRISDRSGCVL